MMQRGGENATSIGNALANSQSKIASTSQLRFGNNIAGVEVKVKQEKWTIIESAIDEMRNDAMEYLRGYVLLYSIFLAAYRIALLVCVALEKLSLGDVIVKR